MLYTSTNIKKSKNLKLFYKILRYKFYFMDVFLLLS